MDYNFSIFQGVLSTEGTYRDIYLDALDEHVKHGTKKIKEDGLIQQISSLLTTPTSFILGLRLLDKMIDNCAIDALEKKGNLWITLVLKACNNEELRCDAYLIFRVLTKIITNSQKAPDFANSFVATHISKVYDVLTNLPLSKLKYALNCIKTCLQVYSGASSLSRGVIERFLWKNLDRIDYEVEQNCGKCLHLLQQVKVVGVQGVCQKTQWKNYQFQLLEGIHSVYNDMFANCVEMYEEKIEQEKSPWKADAVNNYDPEPVKRAAQMYARFHNMVTYLIIAIRDPFPVEKPILIKKILNIVVRGMSVNCLTLEQNPIADNIALGILLPKLHVDLLNLLNVVVTILHGHIRPYSELILGLLIDTLKWTSVKNTHGYQKTFYSLRKKVYDTISLWSKIFGNGSRCETISEYLFKEVTCDITPMQSEIIIKVLSGSQKHMSKKARRQLRNAQNKESNMSKTYSGDRSRRDHFSEKSNQELCTSALCCLQDVVFSVGNFVKPNILKIIQSNITKLCAILYEVDQAPSHLYSNKDCRIGIYNVLYAFLMTTHDLCPPPVELILAIIQTANARDESVEVRLQCGFILKSLEKIIHPQKESLLFAIEARDIRNTFIQMGQERLLRDFDLNISNTLSSNVINDDQVIDTFGSTTGNEDGDINNGNIVETNNALVAESINKIESNHTCSNSLSEIETKKTKVIKIDEHILARVSYTTNKHFDTDVVEITMDDEPKDDAMKKNEINEPRKKKKKLDTEHSKTEYSNVKDDMYQEEDNVLAAIASQFIDELE